MNDESHETLLTIPDAAERYGLDVKRLRGLVFRNLLIDPIGDPYVDMVYDDWRLKRLERK